MIRTETILLAIFNRSYQQKVVQLYVRKEIRMQDIGKANLRKVAVIGCGFVGSASAFALMQSGLFSEMVLIDADTDKAQGEALDISHGVPLARPINIYGGNYDDIVDAAIIIITAGANQKPGETRLDLVKKNVNIYKSIIPEIASRNCHGTILVVSNPVDILTYTALKISGFPKNRVIGMGGALDSSRFKYFLSQALGCNANEVEGMVIGGHGDTTMIPLTRFATYKGMPVSNFLSEEKLQEVAAATMVGGATLTKLLGTSAWYAPGAAGAFVVESIIHNQGKMVPCSVYLEGEYGESDICCGVPVILGKNGIEKIVELPLNEEEKAKFAASAAAVRKTNAALHEVGAL